jgi:hypothetical protein
MAPSMYVCNTARVAVLPSRSRARRGNACPPPPPPHTSPWTTHRAASLAHCHATLPARCCVGCVDAGTGRLTGTASLCTSSALVRSRTACSLAGAPVSVCRVWSSPRACSGGDVGRERVAPAITPPAQAHARTRPPTPSRPRRRHPGLCHDGPTAGRGPHCHDAHSAHGDLHGGVQQGARRARATIARSCPPPPPLPHPHRVPFRARLVLPAPCSVPRARAKYRVWSWGLHHRRVAVSRVFGLPPPPFSTPAPTVACYLSNLHHRPPFHPPLHPPPLASRRQELADQRQCPAL